MQIKTFSARSAGAVLAQIREDFGPEAVILETSEEDGLVRMTAAREPAPAAPGASLPGRAARDALSPPAGGQTEQMLWLEEWNHIRTHLLALMKPALKLGDLPPRQRLALEFLQREGVDDRAMLDLFSRLKADPAASILAPLGEMVLIRPWSLAGWPQPVQILAGPFGAGKTSVALRMALLLRKESPGLRICLVNADATRGSGRLFLRHYAELSDMDYREAASTVELASCLLNAEKERYDRIFLDLPGLARRTFLKTLLADAGLLEAPAKAAVHLVLEPHYGEKILAGLLERYASGLPGSLVWTKLDEAEHFGQMVNAALATGLPISALSYGPGLGGSLAPARDITLWRLLFKKELP
ncbi:MAG: flagellar biosynthesis protein FlhF [Desulfovibrio sp.]|jgi:flagellar biosynthesis protein FlhF|nr:flagellar biosynthesis protein FlhF [Desulfovibrio sp.]